MSGIVEKAWGRAHPVVPAASAGQRVEVAQISPGGRSSVHRHARQANLFVVVAGTLTVELWGPAGATRPARPAPARARRLQAGDRLAVPAGEWHRFVAGDATPVTVVEVYTPTGAGPADPADIVRAEPPLP